MRRVLIVEESHTLVQSITEGCFADDEVRNCADGNLALRMLTEFMPEILLINLSLPYKDGLEVLREAAYLPRQIIAFSYWSNPCIWSILGCLGVQYGLHMPTPNSVRHALASMETAPTGIRADLRASVITHLQRLGFSPNLDGYTMLLVGLPLFYADPQQPLTKELYPAIACALGQGNSQNIERSLRQAITTAWKQRNDQQWQQYFPCNAKGQISKPSNKKFLAALVNRLQQEAEGYEKHDDNRS